MDEIIDFTRGGYHGDWLEETFKPFTAQHMPFWWHFREVLRANHLAADYWKYADGTVLSDDDQRELVALSMLNYAVFTGVAEAYAFFDEMRLSLTEPNSLGLRIFRVRRQWKSMYSSLYSSFNALCNILVVVVGLKSSFGEKRNAVWNYTPKDAYNCVNGKGLKDLADPVDRCRNRLKIRDHLDHYWTIWVNIDQNLFLMDNNFEKGYVPLHHDADILANVDASILASEDLVNCVKDYDLIYRKLAVKGGYLDQYLLSKRWIIDYAGIDLRHNGTRPLP